jgi:hypothetical protein
MLMATSSVGSLPIFSASSVMVIDFDLCGRSWVS